ncbi:MAG: arginase family protein [Pseudomonadota bacterium]
MTNNSRDIALTVYCARTGDRNARAMAGARVLGDALSKRYGLPAATIGQPGPPLGKGWQADLADAMPALAALAAHLDGIFKRGMAPLLVLNRCAAALATLPVLARHRPDASVVWFDAHGDLNTPQTSPSGYLGGMALAGPAGLWNSGLGNGLRLTNIILVGARDLDPAERALVESGSVRLVATGKDSMHALRAALAGRPAYVHLDCDVLAPGIVPTDYRVPGGFSLGELRALCEILAQGPLIGLEIAEFEDSWADSGMPAVPDALLDALDPVIARLGTD